MMLAGVSMVLCAMFASQSEAVTSHVRDVFIKAINDARSHEATSEHVANMWKVSWDSTLAHQAQQYANQCKWEHSHTAGVAETLYASSSDTQDDAHYATLAVNAWMAEKKYDTHSNFGCCHSNCGHYCILVRDVYSKVGCGVKKCQHVGSFTTGTIVVCQFKSVGHGDANHYTHGATCSKCGSHAHCSNHLCVHG